MKFTMGVIAVGVVAIACIAGLMLHRQIQNDRLQAAQLAKQKADDQVKAQITYRNSLTYQMLSVPKSIAAIKQSMNSGIIDQTSGMKMINDLLQGETAIQAKAAEFDRTNTALISQ
jgi:hypothetical protein